MEKKGKNKRERRVEDEREREREREKRNKKPKEAGFRFRPLTFGLHINISTVAHPIQPNFHLSILPQHGLLPLTGPPRLLAESLDPRH